MKKRRNISLLITILILCFSIIIPTVINRKDSVTITTNQTNAVIKSPIKNEEEMRGLWVSFISLDMNGTDRSFDSFKSKFDDIIDKAKEFNCNTLIIQVRPFSDALYNSEIYPHSHILSGIQGEDPGYDALEYMCSVAHKENLQLHAWINPYRVKTSETPDILSDNNIFMTNPEICIETESGVYLNPAKKESRELILIGIEEIAQKYDIDGIQFDDYFYPPDLNDADQYDYDAYKESLHSGKGMLSIQEWRKTNVSILIAEVYSTIKNIDKNIVFGISPQGNLQNNDDICADVESWCKYPGYVDYICPQMYYSVDNEALGFKDSLKQWSELTYHNSVKIYIGLGAYKAGTDADNGTWSEGNILATELTLLRKYNFSGFMIYDYNALTKESAYKEFKNLKSVI